MAPPRRKKGKAPATTTSATKPPVPPSPSSSAPTRRPFFLFSDARRVVPNYFTHTREWNAAYESALPEFLSLRISSTEGPDPSVLGEEAETRRNDFRKAITSTVADIQRTAEFSAAHGNDLLEKWVGLSALEREEIWLDSLKLVVHGWPWGAEGTSIRENPRLLAPEVTLDSMARENDGRAFVALAQQFLVDLSSLPEHGIGFPVPRHAAYEKILGINLDQQWPAGRVQRAAQELDVMYRTKFVSKFVSHVLKSLDGTRARVATQLNTRYGGTGEDWVKFQATAGCDQCGRHEVAGEIKLLKCQPCLQKYNRIVRYCSLACQKAAWPRHKKECGKPLTPISETAIFDPVAPLPRAPPTASRRLLAVFTLLREFPRGSIWPLPTPNGVPLVMASPTNRNGDLSGTLHRLAIECRDRAVETRNLEQVGLLLTLLLFFVYCNSEDSTFEGVDPKRLLPEMTATFEVSEEELVAALPGRRKLDEVTEGDRKLLTAVVFSTFAQLEGTYDLSDTTPKVLEQTETFIRQLSNLMPVDEAYSGTARTLTLSLYSERPHAPLVSIMLSTVAQRRALTDAMMDALLEATMEHRHAFIRVAFSAVDEQALTRDPTWSKDPRRNLVRAGILEYATSVYRFPGLDISDEVAANELVDIADKAIKGEGDVRWLGAAAVGVRFLIFTTVSYLWQWELDREIVSKLMGESITADEARFAQCDR